MDLIIKKRCAWSINREPVSFFEGQKISVPSDVSESIANQMLENGYAYNSGEQNVEEKITKETIVQENKAVESVEENKVEMPKRRGRPKKVNKDMDFEPHIPVKGQMTLDK